MDRLITRTPSVFVYRSSQEGSRLKTLLEAVDPEMRWVGAHRLTDGQIDIGECGCVVMLRRVLRDEIISEAGWIAGAKNKELSIAAGVCANSWCVHKDDVWVMPLDELEQLLGVGFDEAYDCTAVSCADIFALTC